MTRASVRDTVQWLTEPTKNSYKESVDAWVRDGRPEVWNKVGQVDGMIVAVDVAYGRIALIKDDAFVAISNHFIQYEDLVVLDESYGDEVQVYRRVPMQEV